MPLYPILTDRTGPDPGTPSILEAWINASAHTAESVVEANRATLSTFGLTPTDPEDGVTSVSYSRPDWDRERTVSNPDNITVGDTVRFTKRFTDEDVQAFADASGDTNRLHLEDAYASQTRFGGRIVHGTLVSGLISAALARLPGLTIYLSQDIEFKKPVQIGDRVTAVVEVVEDLGDDRYRLTTDVTDADTTYVTGEAIVLMDSHPTDAPGTDDETST